MPKAKDQPSGDEEREPRNQGGQPQEDPPLGENEEANEAPKYDNEIGEDAERRQGR